MNNESYVTVPDQGKLCKPWIPSIDPNKRKLARRIRIQQHLDALSKRTGRPAEEAVEKTTIERRILASTDLLEKLAADGAQVVSSVKIANDASELERRREDQQTQRKLLRKLENEDNECTRRYYDITEKWTEILSSKDPLNIHAEMTAQNTKCLKVLAKKNTVIATLREELENADVKFAEDQKKQNEDIDLLMERMEKQVQTMARAYRQELLSVENAIESERKALLETAIGKWESLYKKLQEDGRAGIEKRKAIMREYEEEMMSSIMYHQEEFRSQKIKFELEIQNLQQEVQTMKTLCLMNIEKLDYSYAVLKHREGENIIIKNQQMRRINKLQDMVNELKQNYAEIEESTRLEIQKLTDQVLKAYKGILDLEKKSYHFTIVNDRKYMQIWDMNIKSANELIDKMLTVDKIIHEQALGLEWQPPEKQLLKKEDLQSYCNAVAAMRNESLKHTNGKMIPKFCQPASTLEEINLERQLLNHIVRQIANERGYLMEDSLQKLLKHYAEEDRLVIRLDNVFQALGIKSEEELRYLLNFLLPYAYCPTCRARPVSAFSICGRSEEGSPFTTMNVCPDVCETTEEFNEAEARLVAALKETVVPSEKLQDDNNVCVPGSAPRTSVTETSSANAEIPTTSVSAFTKPATEESETKRRLLCEAGHPLEIETALVWRSLREFIEGHEFLRPEHDSFLIEGKYSQRERMIVSGKITVADMFAFWERYRDVFPEGRERLWDVLLVGLNRYYKVLKERHRFNNETESLRRQNTELHRLLKTYTIESDTDQTPVE